MPTRKTTTHLNNPESASPPAEKPTTPPAKATPQRLTASRDELIERKKLAGAGRREEPGTAFGSRWTQAERDELQALFDEHGREQAIAQFVAKHPHRTANGAAYQIDRNLKKAAK